ncbi:hypothetical protein [Nocardioides sp.]|uniref:hypothetical protein n=1 Tax=Nocardioides sp. TaxID=35761 RepID=UPI0027370106|nr:hypothetical protein [Nocardioides sp.]MDP3889606.1 hypothetical protein [Nocardioides sp.]
MPTAPSWSSATRSTVDVGHLIRFRLTAARGRRRSWWAAFLMLALTVAAAVVPAYLPGADAAIESHTRAVEVLVLLPTAYAAFLGLAVVSAVASGGGRELLPREQAVAYPVSPTTDHLGALLMAPLNIAWLLQAWLLLGATAYGMGSSGLLVAQPVTVLWLLAATAVGQVVAWTMEAVRRGRGGPVASRALIGLAAAAVAAVYFSGNLTALLDRLPTRELVVGMLVGFGWTWALVVLVEAGILLGAVVLGIWPARVAARRLPHDEQRIESGVHQARPLAASDLGALLRIDRASVWRAVPMRRGLAVLAIGPGLVALAGDLPWVAMTVLPGLVASGAALLFGVNAWCLDGRGALWRENLPVAAGTVFTARAIVLAEFLLLASAVSLVLASLRAGAPEPHEIVALVCTWLVVTVQVLASAMTWSLRNPFAVDLRSARATPAPPVVMVGYSARLALLTTTTGLVFSGLARLPAWEMSVLVAVPLLLFATRRLVRAHAGWVDPVARSRVVSVVSS